MSTTDTQLEAVRTAVEPAVGALGLDVYDLELVGGGATRTLRLTVTRAGGVDLESITAVTQAVSPIVDQAATISGSYFLEVSSPGIERSLRRPEHYASALGEEISIKFHTGAGPRRLRGVLREFDGDRCVVDTDEGEETIPLTDVTQARTVFEWGPQSRPRSQAKHAKPRGRARAKGKS